VVCDGKRFGDAVLEYRLGGRGISEVSAAVSARWRRDRSGAAPDSVPMKRFKPEDVTS
jgi:hypothetical protein